MKIKQITFDDNEMPVTVTAEMTIREAVFIASLIGKLSAYDAKEIVPDGDVALGGIWDSFSQTVFIPYWEEGLDGAKKL